MEWVFTFGQGHAHSTTGERLDRRFVRIKGDYEEARLVMVRHFGQKWSHQYRTPREAGVKQYGLLELIRDDWPPAVIPGKTVEDCMDAARERDKWAEIQEESDREDRRLMED